MCVIGELRDARHACTDARHLPTCYNPGSRDTYCQCGEKRWSGQVGTWHSRALHGPDDRAPGQARRARPIVGWDVYYLHAEECRQRVALGPDAGPCVEGCAA
jgi:hypothetical protein